MAAPASRMEGKEGRQVERQAEEERASNSVPPRRSVTLARSCLHLTEALCRGILYVQRGNPQAHYHPPCKIPRCAIIWCVYSQPGGIYHSNRYSAVDYRLAPETRFPGPLHDAVTAYFRLVDELHVPPENIVVAGDSAGGGLTLALLMYLRDNGYPLPSGAILMSPWVGMYLFFLS